MGSSAKKKKEKKKDFQKAKLKVGKTKAKPSNFTDTSFKAKSIVLSQQSIYAKAPDVVAQFSHHLSLLNHKSDTQRRESLAYLTSVIISVPPGFPLPQPVSIILPEVQRLILDGSNGVRLQLLKLLQALPPAEIASHVDQLLLYTRAGMTHLATEIRIFALDVLDWLLQVASDEVVSCAGGWVKTLKTFLDLLSWNTTSVSKWSGASRASFGKPADTKIVVKQMNSLANFLRAGLLPPQRDATLQQTGQGWDCFPLWHLQHHVLPRRSNAYAHLNLFGAPRDEETEMYEDREDRQRVFHDRAEAAVVAGFEEAKKGGGELGRAAAGLRKVVVEGMADFKGKEIGP